MRKATSLRADLSRWIVFHQKVKYFNSFRLQHFPYEEWKKINLDFLWVNAGSVGLACDSLLWYNWNCINEFETFDKIFIRTFLNLIYYQEYSIKKSSLGFMLRIKTVIHSIRWKLNLINIDVKTELETPRRNVNNFPARHKHVKLYNN